MGNKVKAEESKKVDDGKHEGTIKEVVSRTDPYEYTDLIIELGKSEEFPGLQLKAGFPTKLTKDTSLGALLARFGIDIEIGKEYDVEELLKDKQVVFQTLTKKTEKGTFANVIQDSIKPK